MPRASQLKRVEMSRRWKLRRLRPRIQLSENMTLCAVVGTFTIQEPGVGYIKSEELIWKEQRHKALLHYCCNDLAEGEKVFSAL